MCHYNLAFKCNTPVFNFNLISIFMLIKLKLLSRGEANTDNVAVPPSPNQHLYDWVLSEILFVNEMRHLDVSRLKEKYFYEELQSYLQDFDDTVRDLRGYGGIPTEKAAAVCSNPIGSHRAMRRVAYVLPHLRKHMEFEDFKYDKMFPENDWITVKDVNESMHGILRVHDVYDLDVELFADGLISGIDTGVKLLGIHCYEIGVYAHDQEIHTLSIQWLQLALSKSHVDQTVDKSLIESARQAAMHSHDEEFDQFSKSDPYFFTHKLLIPTMNNLTDTDLTHCAGAAPRETQRKRLVKESKGRKEIKFNEYNFWELCTNGGFKSVEDQSKLFCWLETKVHVYWLINPLKMEMLARDPDVYQVYDVIRDMKISKIREVASPTLKPSLVGDLDNPGQSKKSGFRTSLNTWIEEGDFPETASLPLRIQQITGINVVKHSSSEPLQVASYAFGGHYAVHQDAMKLDYEYGEYGDRVATFMFYLSDVELGGRTAFPQGGIAASPVKGSAIFWYGLHTEGVADAHTFHGACPVLLGTKWVATKWIRYYDQFLIRKCSLKQGERFKVSVNNVEGGFCSDVS